MFITHHAAAQRDYGGVYYSTKPRLNPMFAKPRCIQNFQAWLFYTRYFRRLGVKIAGKYYNDNRHAIKREIRIRVSQVLDGFDLTCQTQLFSSDVTRLAELSKQIELLSNVSVSRVAV